MLVTAAVSSNVTDGLYIVAFSLFIYGMSGLTGPRTAVRGNLIAATGMAVAIISTLIQPHVFDGSSTPWLIALGLVLGTAVGIPAARRVHMTAMPQMVALFNGVGGGAVAIIAWVEYRHHFLTGGSNWALKSEIPLAAGRDHRLDLLLGLQYRLREAAGHPARPAHQAAGAVDHQPAHAGGGGGQCSRAVRRDPLPGAAHPGRHECAGEHQAHALANRAPAGRQ